MQIQELTVKRRDATGKQVAKRLRRDGVVPAVLYGGSRPEAVTVEPRAVLRILHGHEGSTQLLTLTFEGEDGSRLAIIRDLQYDPVSEVLLHVDLQEVTADRAITVRVAVHPTGEAPGVKEQQGIQNFVLHELEISCLPTQIPERIDADVSALMIGDVLTVKHLRAPAGVRILNDPDQAVVTIAPPMAEEPVPAAPEAAAVTAEPEVLTERRAKEEEPAAAEEGKRERERDRDKQKR